MQSSTWVPEHSQALREYVAKGMSHSEIADAINSRFGSAYSRNAAIGRGRRIGLTAPDRPEDAPKRPPKAETQRLKTPRLRAAEVEGTKLA
jgi:GcrA cell cycle regulator